MSLVLLSTFIHLAHAQEQAVTERMAATATTALWRDPAKNETGVPARWAYEYGVVLKGIEGVWLNTGDGRYFSFI